MIDSRGDSRAASAGDLYIGRLKARGAAGIVTDGGFRDTNGVFRTGLAIVGLRRPTGAARPPALPADELSVYTVLVPLHDEANVVVPLVRHLSRLDYPADRLEILVARGIGASFVAPDADLAEVRAFLTEKLAER